MYTLDFNDMLTEGTREPGVSMPMKTSVYRNAKTYSLYAYDSTIDSYALTTVVDNSSFTGSHTQP